MAATSPTSPKSPKKGPVWSKTSQCWMMPQAKKSELGPSPIVTSRPGKDCSWSKTQHAWMPHSSVEAVEEPATPVAEPRVEEADAMDRKPALQPPQPSVSSTKGAMYGECTKTNDLSEWKQLDLRPRIPTKLHMENWRCAAGP